MHSLTILLVVAAVFIGQGSTVEVSEALKKEVTNHIKKMCKQCEVKEWKDMTYKTITNGYEYTVKYEVYNPETKKTDNCKTYVTADNKGDKKKKFSYKSQEIDCE